MILSHDYSAEIIIKSWLKLREAQRLRHCCRRRANDYRVYAVCDVRNESCTNADRIVNIPRELNTECLTAYTGCSASYAIPAYALQPHRVLNALSILILFRAVVPLSVWQQSTGRDSDKPPHTSVAFHRLALPGLSAYKAHLRFLAFCTAKQ